MVRRAVTTALAAATIAAPAAGAGPIRGQALMPGVVYSRQVEFTAHGPVVLNVVSAPKPTGLYSARAVLSGGSVPGRTRLTDMENELAGTTTTVGVNGDLFDARWGTPSGVLVRGGEVVTGTRGGRSAAGFDAAGNLHVDRLSFAGSWKGTGQQFLPLGLNDPPGRSGTTLYTPAWGPTTPKEDGTVEVVLAPFPSATQNTMLTAPVTQVLQGGGQAIPAGGAVLVARGSQAQTLSAQAPVGANLAVRLILTPGWPDVVDGIGGGPVLVRNGRAVFRSNELFTPAQLFARTARSAVGQTADGHVLLVTVDGGRPGYSMGLTNFELALALMRLGAANACALGTGGSAALAFDGKLLSRPSGDASVADALVLTYDGVYVPAPVASTPVGKPVSLAYKIVRPSSVAATLTGPDGSTATLDSGLHTAGTYHVDWIASAEGHWTFAVTATDDLGRRTSSDRTFTVAASAKRR